jgi:hypothetical protein
MALLRDTVEADGAKFVVIPWTNFSDIDPDWRQRLAKQFGSVPQEMVPARLDERLLKIAARENITMEFLTPYLQAYRDAHHLSWPYFSLPCDPHFSALGHQVAAAAIVDLLQRRQLLPAPAAAH